MLRNLPLIKMRALWLGLTLAIACQMQAQNGDLVAGSRAFPELSLGGGVSLRFVRVFSADRDVERKFRLGDLAGPPDPDRVHPYSRPDQPASASNPDVIVDSPHRVRPARTQSSLSQLADVVTGLLPGRELRMTLPYRIAVDSRRRVIVTDPPAHAVHIFDFQKKKYLRIQGGEGRRLQTPTAVAVDAEDNIYVTDAALGMVLVYDPLGNFLHFFGENDGEGLFDRPNSIAIDRRTGHIFVDDTSRRLVFMLDAQGTVLERFGLSEDKRAALARRSEEDSGDLAVNSDELILADGNTCTLRIYDLHGGFQRQIDILDGCAGHPRAVSLGVDADSNIYVSDGASGTVYVYDRRGWFLFAFGHNGSARGEFNSPGGIQIDSQGLIYVADSKNHRVQVFEIDVERESHYPGIFKRLEPKPESDEVGETVPD